MIQVFENEFNKIELHFTTISKISLYHRLKKQFNKIFLIFVFLIFQFHKKSL